MTVTVQVNIITPGLHPDGSRHRRLIISMASFLPGKWRRYWVIEWLAWLVLFDCQMIWFYPQMTISTSPLVEEIILWTSSKDLPFNWMPFHSRTWSPVDWFERGNEKSFDVNNNRSRPKKMRNTFLNFSVSVDNTSRWYFRHKSSNFTTSIGDFQSTDHSHSQSVVFHHRSTDRVRFCVLRVVCWCWRWRDERQDTNDTIRPVIERLEIRNDQTCSGARFGITSE